MLVLHRTTRSSSRTACGARRAASLKSSGTLEWDIRAPDERRYECARSVHVLSTSRSHVFE